jgi:Tol biopolymer transport system component
MFNAVEGRPPYEGPDYDSVLLILLTQDPPAPRRAGPLAPVISALMRKEPERRPASDEVADRLDRIVHQPTTPPKPTAKPTPTPTPPGNVPPSASSVHTPRHQPRRRSRGGALALVVVAFAAVIGLANGGLHFTPHTTSGGPPAPSFPVFPSASSPPPISTTAFNVTAVSQDGRIAAFGGGSGTVRLYDTKSRHQLLAFNPINYGNPDIGALAFSPDGKTLAVGKKYDSDVQIWDLSASGTDNLSGKAKYTLHGATATDGVAALRFGSDGRSIVASDADGTTGTWYTDTSETEIVTSYGNPDCRTAVLSPDAREVACATKDGSLFVKDVATDMETASWIMAKNLDAYAFTPDGKEIAIATGGTGGEVGLWSIDDHEMIRTFPVAVNTTAGTMAVSPDGRTLAVPTMDNAGDSVIELWAVNSGKKIATLPNTEDLRSLRFTPDSRMLFTANDVGGELWDVRSHERLAFWTP